MDSIKTVDSAKDRDDMESAVTAVLTTMETITFHHACTIRDWTFIYAAFALILALLPAFNTSHVYDELDQACIVLYFLFTIATLFFITMTCFLATLSGNTRRFLSSFTRHQQILLLCMYVIGIRIIYIVRVKDPFSPICVKAPSLDDDI